MSPFEVEYLQGGEYEVAATLQVEAEAERGRREVLCELQFTAAAGWTVEQILLDGR